MHALTSSLLKIEFIKKMLLHTGNALCECLFTIKLTKVLPTAVNAVLFSLFVFSDQYQIYQGFLCENFSVVYSGNSLFSTQSLSRLTNWCVITCVMVFCKVFFLFSYFNLILWGSTSRIVSLKHEFCSYEKHNNF